MVLVAAGTVPGGDVRRDSGEREADLWSFGACANISAVRSKVGTGEFREGLELTEEVVKVLSEDDLLIRLHHEDDEVLRLHRLLVVFVAEHTHLNAV